MDEVLKNKNTLYYIFLYLYLVYFIYTSDNWMDNNSPGGRGGRDSDNWSSRGGGRDLDKWGGRGGGRESDAWGGRGNRPSPWRGNGNRRRNDDWEGSNQKRWRRDDNPEWDEQQKPWKRGITNEDEERQSMWPAGKKDEEHFSKYKNRDNNEERPRKPSKWGDKEPDEVEEDWDIIAVEQGTSKDESKIEEGPHQTSAPMDLDNYEGECTDNIEQLHVVQEQEISNLNDEFGQGNFEKEQHNDEIQQNHNKSSFNEETYQGQGKEDIILNNDVQLNDDQQYEDYQNDFSNNPQKLPHDNIEEMQQNSERQFQGNFEEQYTEDKKHNDCEKNTFNDFNSQCDYSSREKDNNTYDYERPSYDELIGDKLSHNSNSQGQHLDNNFVTQTDKIIEENFTEEKSLGSKGNFYFGTDCESPINNKSVEIEQQISENVIVEGTKLDLPDNNESYEANTVELN